MCLHMFSCFCMRMYIFTYIYVRFSFVHVCINVCVCTYLYTYIHVCMWVCFYVYPSVCGSISVHSFRVIIPLSSLIFQGIHQQLPLTTSSVMFFPRSFGVLGFLTSYTSTKVIQIVLISHQCPWCSRYRRRNWTRRHEFKSWTRLIAFHIALTPLGKVWIQLFSLQLWVNSRTD